jgi:hypothetical protein
MSKRDLSGRHSCTHLYLRGICTLAQLIPILMRDGWLHGMQASCAERAAAQQDIQAQLEASLVAETQVR